MDITYLSVLYGLASAASWGAGDFSGGLATKRSHIYTVLVISQLIGGALLFALTFVFVEAIPPLDSLLIGSLAGICGGFGLVALYSSLASGQMGVVAPVAAVVTAMLPVLVGVFSEGWPLGRQLVGFGLAFVAVWLLARGNSAAPIRLAALKLPAVSGIGFGLFFVLTDQISSGSILWPLIAARITTIMIFLAIARWQRQTLRPAKDQLLTIALAGIFDTGGNAFFMLAARFGRLDISAVLSSLYPVATVLLAWLVLKERLGRRQWLGVAAALLALALIAL